MKLLNCGYYPDHTTTTCSELFVEGLGNIKITNCLSDETKNIIEKECILALRQKLGQVIVEPKPQHIMELH